MRQLVPIQRPKFLSIEICLRARRRDAQPLTYRNERPSVRRQISAGRRLEEHAFDATSATSRITLAAADRLGIADGNALRLVQVHDLVHTGATPREGLCLRVRAGRLCAVMRYQERF